MSDSGEMVWLGGGGVADGREGVWLEGEDGGGGGGSICD